MLALLGVALLAIAVAAPGMPHAAVLALGFIGALLLSIAALGRTQARSDPQRRRVVRVGLVLVAIQVTALVRVFRIGVVHPAEVASRRAVSGEEDVLTNPRITDLRLTQPRGRLVAADGTVLARSLPIATGLMRSYDEPSAYSLVGYFSPLKFGLSGLEASVDAELTGVANPSVAGALERVFLGGEGTAATVHLSIETSAQGLATELLVGLTGSAVLLDYETGRVLAMASSPSIDPNRLSAYDAESAATAQEYWDELLADAGKPLLSRATTGLYPPGSTFKVVTAAAAVETRVASADSIYEDTGVLTIDGRELVERNQPEPGRTEWSLSEGLAYSLNLVYAQVGLAIGGDRLSRACTAFGIGERIPTDVPSESGQIASSPSFLESDSALADTAFGQGELLVTPLHMALVACAVARDGTVPVPTLVDGVSTDGERPESRAPTIWRRAVSRETAAIMDRMMVESATYGYARTAAVDGLRIGAKTGTAESGRAEPHSWFIGYRSDADRPLAVAVCIEFGGEGGGAALTIGRELLAAS